jgi:hypothetical protein
MSFDPDEINHLREVYNREKGGSIPAGDPHKVWKELQSKFHEECRTGAASCIITNMMRKPMAPDSWSVNRYEWLSSDDIAQIEKEYTKLFKGYEFLGCIPIDFDLKDEVGKCIVSTLCSTQLKSLYDKGKRRIGIVFNTDPHDGPGEHWIALFADIRPDLEFPRITYFDSYAQKPEKEIQELMHRWKEQWDATGIHSKPTELTYNKTRHQFKNTECGMYSLYFHYCCLTETPMNSRVPDDVINVIRDILWKKRKVTTS